MLEFFDHLYQRNEGCSVKEIAELEKEIDQLGFPFAGIDSYLNSLLMESNGGTFTNGVREFQFFSVKEIILVYKEYEFANYMPFALPIFSDGCGNFGLFDCRKNNDSKIYWVSASNLGWHSEECHYLAENLEVCIQQKHALL